MVLGLLDVLVLFTDSLLDGRNVTNRMREAQEGRVRCGAEAGLHFLSDARAQHILSLNQEKMWLP